MPVHNFVPVRQWHGIRKKSRKSSTPEAQIATIYLYDDTYIKVQESIIRPWNWKEGWKNSWIVYVNQYVIISACILRVRGKFLKSIWNLRREGPSLEFISKRKTNCCKEFTENCFINQSFVYEILWLRWGFSRLMATLWPLYSYIRVAKIFSDTVHLI